VTPCDGVGQGSNPTVTPYVKIMGEIYT